VESTCRGWSAGFSDEGDMACTARASSRHWVGRPRCRATTARSVTTRRLSWSRHVQRRASCSDCGWRPGAGSALMMTTLVRGTWRPCATYGRGFGHGCSGVLDATGYQGGAMRHVRVTYKQAVRHARPEWSAKPGSRSEFYMERRDSAAAAQYGLNTHDAGLYPDMFNHSWGYVCTSCWIT
jgi:hypothetical protein